MVTVYGIKNCDTCRKALKWLDAAGIEHRFHDYRKDKLDEGLLSAWVEEAGWEKLLNRRGTTWRNLSDAEKDGVDKAKAVFLMRQYPILIKRPVFEFAGGVLVGFGAAERDNLKS